MPYLLVKIFGIDYQTIGALFRWTNGEVGNIVHHLLHAKPIQFHIVEFFIAIVISQSKRESQSCSLYLTKVKYNKVNAVSICTAKHALF